MQFIFYGTIDELKETILLKAKEYNKDIIIYDNEPNVLVGVLDWWRYVRCYYDTCYDDYMYNNNSCIWFVC